MQDVITRARIFIPLIVLYFFGYVFIHIDLNRAGKKRAPSLHVIGHDRIAREFLPIELECCVCLILDDLKELGMIVCVA